MGKLSLDIRLKCNHSYGTEENPNLMCEVCDKVCDGNVYMECQPDVCLYDSKSSCCYPIEDCLSCPIHPGNNDPSGDYQKQNTRTEYCHAKSIKRQTFCILK